MLHELPKGDMGLSVRPYAGCDPEIFVMNDKEDSGSNLIPAFLFLPNKKEASHEYYMHPQAASYNLYWDGFQAEFSTIQGYACLMEQMVYIQSALAGLVEKAKAFDRRARLSICNTVKIPKHFLKEAADEHVELGCKPSKNLYGRMGIIPANGRELLYRVAGGHKHFGDETVRTPNGAKNAVRWLDRILGVWSVGAAAGIDDPIRRRYYGLAGEYRVPKHGLEYRTLSNFWLLHPVAYQATFMVGRLAYCFGTKKAGEYGNIYAGTDEEVEKTINNCDVTHAQKLMARNAPLFRYILGTTVPGQFLFDLGRKLTVLKEFGGTIEKNWDLYPYSQFNPYSETNKRTTVRGYSHG